MKPDLTAIREDAERTGYAPWKDTVFALLDHVERIETALHLSQSVRNGLATQLDRYAAQVTAVRDLHKPDWSDWGIDHPDEGPDCTCGYNGPYPCPTIRILDHVDGQ